MDSSKYTTAYDADGVEILAFGNATVNATALAPVLAALSTDTPPQADAVLAFNQGDKWGETLFRIGATLCKAVFTHRHAMRQQPYVYIDREISGWEGATALGLKVPAYLGAFTVLRPEGYLWNGVLVAFLSGWRNLDPSVAADDAMMRTAIADFAAAGARNLDMHAGNVMTDGSDYRVVDLDRMEFGQDPQAAAAAMTSFYEDSLNW